jgi:hypothetical protein
MIDDITIVKCQKFDELVKYIFKAEFLFYIINQKSLHTKFEKNFTTIGV